MTAITLKSKVLRMTDAEFEAFCLEQRDLKIERNSNGDILIMTPTYSDTGRYNIEILRQLANWNVEMSQGQVFDSSTGFTLPNNAVRSPDASWIAQSRWDALSEKQQKSFAPIAPDFVVELKSATDHLPTLQEKMHEWIGNGVKLGWLIDVESQNVEIYQADGSSQKILDFDQNLSGSPVLPGFVLELPRLKL
ncbi:Uma2 family endonuclease [uncultured Microscilla sp.]|uniref:Uma2 family endonuclease n=1 Tax=uncultured Microscilla sp. TaxID=432653 RepID=UPI002614C29F|nr:Uma2 family endonuclease [uncultured Microscilla sp.]